MSIRDLIADFTDCNAETLRIRQKLSLDVYKKVKALFDTYNEEENKMCLVSLVDCSCYGNGEVEIKITIDKRCDDFDGTVTYDITRIIVLGLSSGEDSLDNIPNLRIVVKIA